MKKHLLSLILIHLGVSVSHAQSPDRLSYQAVVRNASGNPVVSQSVGSRISILKGSATGSAVYVETQQATTSGSGVLNLEIGGGKVESGSLSGIDWSQGPYFAKVETDPAGGTNYAIVGATQLLSVPYALFAKSSALRYSSSGDTLYSGNQFVIVPGLSAANTGTAGAGSPAVTTSVVSSVTTNSASLGGNVTSGGSSAVTARGICYSTTASPTTSNSTVASGTGTGSFNVTLTGLSAATTYYARAYAVNGSGTSYGNQVTFRTEGSAGQDCAQGGSITVTHTAGDVSPVTKTVTYKIVQTDLSGESKCWLAQNLGADRQATSFNDFSEQSAGWYWQFNRKQGYKHDGIFTRTPSNTWTSNIDENLNWIQSNDPCNLSLGSGWRIPTVTEWGRVASNGKFGERTNYFSSDLRIHLAGYLLLSDGGLRDRGVTIFIWTANQGSSSRANFLQFANESGGLGGVTLEKHFGFSIRCIKD